MAVNGWTYNATSKLYKQNIAAPDVTDSSSIVVTYDNQFTAILTNVWADSVGLDVVRFVSTLNPLTDIDVNILVIA